MKNLDALHHRLDRTLDIEAHRETVFRFFTDTARWATWWGAGSTVDPRVGGQVLIRYPDGTEVRGEVVEIVPPERFVFTYGFVKGTPIPAGSSVVTIQLEPRGSATRLHLSHAFAESTVRDQHVQGWRYQLSLFANVIADEVLAGAANIVDQWFATWSQTDSAAVQSSLQTIASPQVRMRDRFSAVQGV